MIINSRDDKPLERVFLGLQELNEDMLAEDLNQWYIRFISKEPPEIRFELTLEECKALNILLKLYGGQLKQSPAEYEQILRLINGLNQFVDRFEQDKK